MPAITAYADGILIHNQVQVKCALGKGGVIAQKAKREGDGASPVGIFPIRKVHYRSDRIAAPETALPVRQIRPEDGWCDASDHPDYNRLITRPLDASHEKLWRDDHVYDVLVELGFNDDPVVPGKGSAIFFHLKRGDYEPTLGCVAVSLDDMLAILKGLKPGDQFEITQALSV